ncbi:MAG: hypothetical protein RLZZ621_221 [Gemmatimonadota bacterium]
MREQPNPSQPASPTEAATPAAQAPPAPTSRRGTIVIQETGGQPVTINVDRRGIHLRQGREVTTIPIRDVVPRGLVQLSWAFVALLVLFSIVRPITRAVVRWIDRRAVVDREQAALRQEMSTRLATLERNLDTAAVEIERLAEAQRFATRLLTERQHDAVPPAS